MIQSPYDALTANSCMTFEVASIRLTAEIGVPTILADYEDGLSIQEIAEKTGVDSLKLGPSSSLSDGEKVIDRDIPLCRTCSSSFSYPRLVS